MALKLTPTEQKLYDLLADGEPHKRKELLALVDDQADPSALHKHMYRLRLKLKVEGEEIVAQSFGKYTAYRRVRHILSNTDD
jgi:hypothetical protein